MNFSKRIVNRVRRAVYGPVERIFRAVERNQLSRGAVLQEIPPSHLRGGGLGTTTYGEWCYTIGVFQTLIFLNLPKDEIRMLDVGCGVGRLYLAAKPYLRSDDHYLGIDITKLSISVCQQHYTAKNVNFVHIPSSNGLYAKDVSESRAAWPIPSDSQNLVTALSVWTHLNEEDWKYYLSEVARVLVKGGRAIITFFILDGLYIPSLKTDEISEFYPQAKNKWIFDTPAYDSREWVSPSWVSVPEVAIAVPDSRFKTEIGEAGLTILEYYPGQWKDQPGFTFQDVVILEKAA